MSIASNMIYIMDNLLDVDHFKLVNKKTQMWIVKINVLPERYKFLKRMSKISELF